MRYFEGETGGTWGDLDPPVTQENRLNAGYGYVAEATEHTLTDPGVLCQAALLKSPNTSLQTDWQQCSAPLSTNSDTKLQFYTFLSYQASVLTAAATSEGQLRHIPTGEHLFSTSGKTFIGGVKNAMKLSEPLNRNPLSVHVGERSADS
ncbi:hypothetical protein NDU88_004805 [Pleurodeles waltl]|uniref:Uncharacterized protein n=1 Tax=Pleurodeles waltl TaxID=8319 RepID=A0AAV7UI34_PLEWA|nr:hypothetical protein NDU88_004805 [Pleurodeles waltl]